MPRRENTFRVDYSQFPKHLSHDEIHKLIGKELGLTRENVLLLQPSRRLGCTFVEVNNLELAERIVEQHDNKHEFVFDGKAYKLRILMEDGAVEVRLFDLSSDVSNDQIAEFLTEFGDVLHVRDLLWDDRFVFGGIKTGVRIARMVVKKNIPSLVTIQGEDTAVGYRGQRQTCLHCQEFVHVGIPCVQNKKLLVQKLAADQSYANVAKQSAPPKTTAKPNNQPQNTSAIPTLPNSSLQVTDKTAKPQQQNKMLPPALPITGQPIIKLTPLQIPNDNLPSLPKSDGNETDSSQTSRGSNRSRKSNGRRSPPPKKGKIAKQNETTNQQHVRDSGEEMQQ